MKQLIILFTFSAVSCILFVSCNGPSPAVSCGQDSKSTFAGTAYIRDKVTATPAPDNHVLTMLFDMRYHTTDTFTLKKDFAIEFGISGKPGDIKVKHDIRYYVKVDTTESIFFTITHLGKENKIEDRTIQPDQNRSFSFTEIIPCDSIGLQKYQVRIFMKNKIKEHVSEIQLDSWDAEIQ